MTEIINEQDIINDINKTKMRDIQHLANQFNILMDDPVIDALVAAWDYGYAEAVEPDGELMDLMLDE